MMRRYEPVFLLCLFITATVCASFWLWKEIDYYRASILPEQVFSGKRSVTVAQKQVITEFSYPNRVVSGKPAYYKSTIAIVAGENIDPTAATRMQFLRNTKERLSAELAREPANSYAWFHLARANWLLDEPGQSVVNALRISIYTSPEDPQLLMERLEMAGMVKDFWDTGFRNLLVRQVVLVWRRIPRSFVSMVKKSHLTDLAREALSDDPAGLALFEALYRNITAPLN